MSNSPKIIYINYSICVAIILAVFTSMFDCLNPFKYSRINNNNSDDNTNTNTNTKVKIRNRNKNCRNKNCRNKKCGNKRCGNKIFPSNCLQRTVSVDSGLSNKPYNNKTAIFSYNNGSVFTKTNTNTNTNDNDNDNNNDNDNDYNNQTLKEVNEDKDENEPINNTVVIEYIPDNQKKYYIEGRVVFPPEDNPGFSLN